MSLDEVSEDLKWRQHKRLKKAQQHQINKKYIREIKKHTSADKQRNMHTSKILYVKFEWYIFVYY